MYQPRREVGLMYATLETNDNAEADDSQAGMAPAEDRNSPQPAQSMIRHELPTTSYSQLDAVAPSSSISVPEQGPQGPADDDIPARNTRSGTPIESNSSTAPVASSSQTTSDDKAPEKAGAIPVESSRDTNASPKRPKRILKKPSTVFTAQPPVKPSSLLSPRSCRIYRKKS